jgi:hypothetical protein
MLNFTCSHIASILANQAAERDIEAAARYMS